MGTDSDEKVSERLVSQLVDMLATHVAVDRLPNHQQMRSRFILDVLRGEERDESEVLRDAEVLGLDLARPRAVMLIDASGYILAPTASAPIMDTSEFILSRAERVISAVADFFDATHDAICATYIGGGEVVALKPRTRKRGASEEETFEPGNPHAWPNLGTLKSASEALASRLTRDTGSEVAIGIGRFHQGVPGIAKSCEDACAALRIGRRLNDGAGVYCLDSLGMAGFVGVADEETKYDLAAYLLDGLANDRELVRTVESFLANDFSPSRTATELCIHRNTPTYRLDKITSLTGLDPRRFEEAVQLRLSLLLTSLKVAADGEMEEELAVPC